MGEMEERISSDLQGKEKERREVLFSGKRGKEQSLA